MICGRCSWIHVDGVGEYCNGCGAKAGSGGPQVTTLQAQRPSFVVDAAFASLLLTLFTLLVAAAR